MIFKKTIKLKKSFWTVALSVDKSIFDISLEDKIRNGFKKNEFYFHYQPKLKLNPITKKLFVTGAELLIRWKKDSINILPDLFIPSAEQSGQIIKFGELVIVEACKTLNFMQKDEILKNLTLSINISPYHICSSNFCFFLKNTLDDYQIDSTKLDVELTERTKFDNYEEMKKKMLEIKSYGVSFSLDDFGSGNASLLCLFHLPFDYIKIDKYFIDKMDTHKSARLVVMHIRDLGKQMNTKVIAEGIETEKQLQTLINNGIFEFQGYYLAKPMSKINFLNFCKSYGKDKNNNAEKLLYDILSCNNIKTANAL